jgi:carboxyl-terminal processing protease
MLFRTPSRAACTLGLATILLVGSTLLAQQLGTLASPQPGKIAQLVCDLIEHEHILQKPIDDTVSERLIDEYTKMLDPQKLYFLAADLDRFNKYRTDLDDLLKAGNVEFAQTLFDVYLARVKERMAVAHKLIDAEHDFTIKESMPLDAKEQPWAQTAEELNERWRRRIKYDMLMLRLEKKSDAAKAKNGASATEEPAAKTVEEQMAEARKRLHKRYKGIYDNLRNTEPDEVVEMYLTALCQTFDPHSNYMSPRSQREFEIQMKLKLEGIGAALKLEDGYTVVASIVPGGAAATDGRLKVNDKIVAVGNGTADFVDCVEMKLTKVVDMIRGKAGTKVRLKVVSAATGDTVVYDLTRQQVQLKSAEVKGEIVETSSRVPGSKARVGVLRIPSFYRDFQGAEAHDADFTSTARDVRKVLRSFRDKGGVDAIVIDLRYNGGGALTEAIDVSGLFIDEGPVVQVKVPKGEPKPLVDDEQGGDLTTPLVVVTNRLSASASEIFAGVIKDYGRGLIVGDKTTHGKGTVQTVSPVGRQPLRFFKQPELGSVKLTIQQFYRVNGQSTQNLGVPSDITLPSLIDNMDLGEQFLDNPMPFDQIGELSHPRLGMVTREMLVALKENSRKRTAASPDFQKVERDIEKYLARKQRKAVTLNEEELRKERVEEEQKARDKAEAIDEMSDEGPVLPDSHYNNEILAITVDYLALLKDRKTAARK